LLLAERVTVVSTYTLQDYLREAERAAFGSPKEHGRH